MWIVIWPTDNRRKLVEIFGRRKSIETGFSPWTWRACSSGLHRKAGLLLVTHEQPQREIWLRLALMWALAALRSREEAEALGENAAVVPRWPHA